MIALVRCIQTRERSFGDLGFQLCSMRVFFKATEFSQRFEKLMGIERFSENMRRSRATRPSGSSAARTFCGLSLPANRTQTEIFAVLFVKWRARRDSNA
jgi:hypothetical protein